MGVYIPMASFMAAMAASVTGHSIAISLKGIMHIKNSLVVSAYFSATPIFQAILIVSGSSDELHIWISPKLKVCFKVRLGIKYQWYE